MKIWDHSPSSVSTADLDCQDKKQKQPPSMSSWLSKTTCMKSKKKGRHAFNYPPKYAFKTIWPKMPNSRYLNKNNDKHCKGWSHSKIHSNRIYWNVYITAIIPWNLIWPWGWRVFLQLLPTSPYVYTYKKDKLSTRNSLNKLSCLSNYRHQKEKIINIHNARVSNHHKDRFYHILFKKTRGNNLYPMLTNELRRSNCNNQLSIMATQFQEWAIYLSNQVPFTKQHIS